MTLTLLGALRGIPRFDQPACVGHHRLFDAEEPTSDSAIALAVDICKTTCPALAQCRAWLDGLPPSQKPAGVIAGVHRKPKKKGKASPK